MSLSLSGSALPGPAHEQTLTPRGAGTLKRLDERVDAAQRAVLEPLSATDRHELRRLLEQLADGA